MNLDLKINDELKENLFGKDIILGGIQYLFKFNNDYGASVVKCKGSYGYRDDQWELAVLNNFYEDDYYDICYDTELTNDVLGYLEDSEVNELLLKIRAL